MDRLLSLALAVALLLSGSVASASLNLPTGLTLIEEEAFMGDGSVAGLVKLPAGVKTVGVDAFTGTGLYALDLPGDVTQLGDQSGLDAAYLRLRGKATAVGEVSSIRCVIAPEGAAAAQLADGQGVRFVPEESLVESNGFYYQDDGSALTLLCAVDAGAVGASATIPEVVSGRPVAALTDFAFMGCTGLTSLRLPSSLKDSPALEGAIGDCPDVRISWIGDPADVRTVQVVTNAQGQLGEGVEWTVEGLDSAPGDQYAYTLTLDGAVIDTATTTEASYAAALTEPGEYQLSVQVSRDGALLAQGISAKLFVASRALELTVPETIRNGENLSVAVTPLDGALSYYILLTDEATGKSVGSRTLSGSGGTAVFSGYTLSPGEYRVTGYVYGNGYALTVPAVEKVTVSDTTRPACPAVKVPDSMAAYRTVKLSLTGGDYEIIEPSNGGSSGPAPTPTPPPPPSSAGSAPTALMRASFKEAEDGSSHGYMPFPPGDMTLYGDTYTLSCPEQGRYELSFSMCVDGVWSDWSPAYTMDVTAPPMLPDPTVTFYDRQTGAEVAEADLVAGKATEIRVSSDKAYSEELSLSFKNGDSWEKMDRLGRNSGPDYTSVIVPVWELAPGQYKLQTTLIPRNPYYSVPEDGFTHEFTVSGEGVLPAPTMTFYDRQTSAEVAEADLVAGRETEIRVSSEAGNLGALSLSYKIGDSWEKMEQFGGSGGGPNIVSMIVPARELAPGQYKLQTNLVPRSPYYSVPEDGFTYEFTVSGEGVVLPELSVDKDEAWLTDDTVTLTIHAEECESASIEAMLTTTEGQRHHGSTTRSLDDDGYATYKWNNSFSDVEADATLVFKVSVSKDGVWSPYARISLPLHPRPQLAAAQVNISGESLTAGQDLTISFPPVVNATRYETEVRNDDGSNSRVYYWDQPAQPDTPFTLPGYALGRGRYRVRVTAYGDGYRSATGEAAFAITGTRPAAPNVTSDSDEIHINGRIAFTVNGEGIEAVRVWYGEDEEQGNGITYTERNTRAVEATDGAFTWSWQAESYMEGWTMVFRFAAKQNGVWSNWREKRYTVLGLPELAQAQILCEGSYPGGADVSFTFAPVANAQSYRVRTTYPDGDYGSNFYNEPATVSFNGYTLEPGTYRVTVEAYADGYITSTAERTFTVTSKASAPSVNVDKTEPAYRDKITFTVACPGAEQLMARIDERWSDYTRINVFEDPTDWTVTANWTGARSFAFAALVDGRWTDWSEPVTLTIAQSPSQLPEPVITAPATIQQGQDLSVSVDANGASEFSFYAYNAQDERVFSRYFYTGSEQITIPGYRLSAGTARLRVEAYGQGSSSTAEKTVSVTAGTRPTPPALDALSRTETKDNDFSFNIPTEGAERIAVRYYRSGDSNDVSYNDFKADGDPTVWTTRCSTSGEVWKYAFARKVNGVWSGWSAICTVQIAQREALRPVVIDAPETLAGGTNLSVSFADPDNGGRATGYELRITKPDGNTVNYWDAQPGKVYTLDGLDLAEGDYTVRVTAKASLYDNGVQTATIAVTGPRAAAPNVTRNGSETVQRGEKISFTIACPGAEQLMARISNERYVMDDTRINVFEDTTDWTVTANWTGARSYAFAALVDGRWTAWSDPITLTVEESPSPQLPQPLIDAPATIQQGQDLTVSVDANGAGEFRIYAYDAQDEQVFSRYFYTGSEQITIPGYRLSAGTARLRVEAYGQGSSSTAEKTVSVTSGTRPTPPTLDALTRTETKDNDFSFNIPTEGAERIAVRYYRSGDSNDVSYNDFKADGNPTVWTTRCSTSGEVWKYAFARKVDGVWSGWSAICTVTIAQREALRPVVIDAPETLAGGTDLSVSFADPDNGGRATGYELRITKPDGNTVNYWDAQPGKVYTLDGLDLSEGDYTVRVTARASLYDNGVQTATIAVTGPRAAAPNVTRNGSETVHSGEKFSFTIANVGGERIAWRKYRDDEIYSSGRLTVREDDTLWETSSDVGIWTYRFSLLKDGAWSAWSEPVKVTVEAWQAMDLAAPQVQPLPGQIAGNADLTVTVTGPEEAREFRVALLDAEENTIDDAYLYEPGEVTFPGYGERSLGTVRVRVYDYGTNGSRNQSEDAIIQVVAGSPGAAPQVTPPEVTESPDREGSFTFAVNAPGADRAVVRMYRRGAPNDMSYAEFELDAAGAGEWTRTASWFSTGEWRMSFAVRVNGAWSQWSPFTGITVG